MEDKINSAEKILNMQLAWVSAADNKIPPIFAIDVAMLGVLATLMPPISEWTICGNIMVFLAIISLIGSIITIGFSAFPRLSGPEGSLIYFGGIVKKSEESYIKAVKNLSDDNKLDDLLKQTYRNAEIARSKYYWLKWSMLLSFISFPFWVISIWNLYT